MVQLLQCPAYQPYSSVTTTKGKASACIIVTWITIITAAPKNNTSLGH